MQFLIQGISQDVCSSHSTFTFQNSNLLFKWREFWKYQEYQLSFKFEETCVGTCKDARKTNWLYFYTSTITGGFPCVVGVTITHLKCKSERSIIKLRMRKWLESGVAGLIAGRRIFQLTISTKYKLYRNRFLL